MTMMVRRSLSFVTLSAATLALSACGVRTSMDSTPYRPLAVGESYRVSSGMTSLPIAYEYKRPAEKVYRVTVPALFRAHEPHLPEAAVKAIEARTAMCLAAAQPMLSGPNGESLEIRLVPAAFSGMQPLVVDVTGLPVRGHARLWQANWACPEIVHEVGHFLGLVDKYPEPAISGRYDCRRIGPHSSLMYDPWDAYAQSSPSLELRRCNCDGLAGEQLAACVDAIQTIDRQTIACPAGTRSQLKSRTLEYATPERAKEVAAAAGQWASDEGTSKYIVLYRLAPRPQLLSPAEFRVIAHPNRVESNRRYYACASDAYRTSKLLNGEGCLATDICDGESWARD